MMNRIMMRGFSIFLVFFLCCWCAPADNLDLPVLGRADLNFYSAMTYYETEGSLFTDGISGTRNRLVRIGLERGEVEEYFEIHRFFGQVEGKLVVATIDRDHILKYHFIDPLILKKQGMPDWKIPIDWAVVGGRNRSFYSARVDARGIYTPYNFDPDTDSLQWLDVKGVPASLSPDTLHLLVQNPEGGEVVIWDIEDGSARGRLRSNAPAGQIRFLSSSVLLVPPEYSGQERWRIHNLEGEEVGALSFRIRGGSPLFLWFSSDLNRAVACMRGALNPETAVLNSEPFKRWLQLQGYLFAPGSGVLNDSRVRIREYPTLSARVLGHLDRGQRVAVLERSGLPVPIDDMNDYWYKVRTDEGLTGWSYGYFITLER
jgi:hypothetical protein